MKQESNINSIAGRIRAIREELKLTQKELSQRLNISGPSLSEFENGKNHPNFDFIYNIYREFGVSLYYLLYGEGEMFEERGGPLSKRLEKLAKENEDVGHLLYYFEKSSVIRYFLLSQFKTKMLMEGDIIEKEITIDETREKEKDV